MERPTDYVVTAVNVVAKSAASAQINATPVNPLWPLAPGKVLTKTGNTLVSISWDNVSSATSNNIYWAHDAGGDSEDRHQDTRREQPVPTDRTDEWNDLLLRRDCRERVRRIAGFLRGERDAVRRSLHCGHRRQRRPRGVGLGLHRRLLHDSYHERHGDGERHCLDL